MKNVELKKSREENPVFSRSFFNYRDGGERRGLFRRFFDAQTSSTSHRDTLPVGGRELRLSRLYRVQRGCKLIRPELLAVSHLAVPLRLLRGRSTRRPQALRQQLDQVRRMRLVPQYQHARGH